jgi:DNA repair protein RadC
MTTTYTIPTLRLAVIRDGATAARVETISRSTDAAALVRTYLGNVDREHFIVLLLDGKHHVIGINTVSVGTLTAALIHPREVFKAAMLTQCAALICAHNHPSGDTTPSREDRELTERLAACGRLLGVPLLDHVIIGDGTDTHFSFADHRLISTDGTP